MCKHIKKVRSSQPAIFSLNWKWHSFSLWVSLSKNYYFFTLGYFELLHLQSSVSEWLHPVQLFFTNVTFLHTRKFIFKNCPLKSRKNVFSGYFWQYHYDYFYCTFIHCWQKKVSLNIEAIKVSQKRRKIIYLYKSVNINFCITFEILSKFQESSIEKFK